jgi:hypothetical protein
MKALGHNSALQFNDKLLTYMGNRISDGLPQPQTRRERADKM